MSLLLEIPDEAIDAMRIPRQEVARELQKELAVALYARGALSLGKAVDLSGISRREFESLLEQRRIERPYDSTEIQRDLDWIRG